MTLGDCDDEGGRKEKSGVLMATQSKDDAQWENFRWVVTGGRERLSEAGGLSGGVRWAFLRFPGPNETPIFRYCPLG